MLIYPQPLHVRLGLPKSTFCISKSLLSRPNTLVTNWQQQEQQNTKYHNEMLHIHESKQKDPMTYIDHTTETGVHQIAQEIPVLHI